MANRKNSGRGGRKPHPTALKLIDGTQPCRINFNEPKAPVGAPEMPGYFDDFERHGWTTFIRDVERLGLLSTVDSHAAALYAVAYARGRRARDAIQAEGLLINGSHGGKVSNPCVGILERAERVMISLLSLYGLSPSDRSRLKATESVEDEFDKFLREKTP
jgi:P27 family predicted phage terminase small subunit